MTDVDNDGWGDVSPVNGAIQPGTDCDDTDPNIRPDASEIPNDSIDQSAMVPMVRVGVV